jgi:hypothetical protein
LLETIAAPEEKFSGAAIVLLNCCGACFSLRGFIPSKNNFQFTCSCANQTGHGKTQKFVILSEAKNLSFFACT